MLKKRTGRHENTIREFSIDNTGLKVGSPLDKFQGVLRGVPQYLGAKRIRNLNIAHDSLSERALILAPQGRDAFVAARILQKQGLSLKYATICQMLLRELVLGAGLAVLTEESIRSADIKGLVKLDQFAAALVGFSFCSPYRARRRR